MTPPVKTMQRVLLPLHWAWQGIEEALASFRKQEENHEKAAKMSASLDGVMIHRVIAQFCPGD